MKGPWLIVVAGGFVFVQIGFAFWFAMSASQFAGETEAYPSLSMFYGMTAGALGISALVMSKLLIVLSFQEGRIRRLEQLANQ